MTHTYLRKRKRNILAGAGLFLGGIWVRPIIKVVALPAHAITSKCVDTLWHIEETFTVVGCHRDAFCHGIPAGEFVPVAPPLYPPVQSNYNFCLSQAELNAGVFNRDIDLGHPEYGSGPAADYIFVKYTIDHQDEFMISGSVETSDVDVFYIFKGTWSATRIA